MLEVMLLDAAVMVLATTLAVDPPEIKVGFEIMVKVAVADARRLRWSKRRVEEEERSRSFSSKSRLLAVKVKTGPITETLPSAKKLVRPKASKMDVLMAVAMLLLVSLLMVL